MTLIRILLLVSALLSQAVAAQDRETLLLVGHANVPRLDLATVQRLYTGRAVEAGGIALVVVNQFPASHQRRRFMAEVMQQADDKYIGYWTVRMHIGKGAPPRELTSADEVIDFVLGTPGGVGYISTADLRPGLNVVLRP